MDDILLSLKYASYNILFLISNKGHAFLLPNSQFNINSKIYILNKSEIRNKIEYIIHLYNNYTFLALN